MKLIKMRIFICFSEEVRTDVEQLKLKLLGFSQRFAGVIDLQIKSWEDFKEKDMHGKNRKLQDFYDKIILGSDLVVFLYYNEWGAQTKHEWDLCLTNKKYKPKVLLGIKRDTDNKKTTSEIRKELGHKDIIIDIPYLGISDILYPILLRICDKLCMHLKSVCRQRFRGGGKTNFNRIVDPSILSLSIQKMKKVQDLVEVKNVAMKYNFSFLPDLERIQLNTPRTLADIMALNRVKTEINRKGYRAVGKKDIF